MVWNIVYDNGIRCLMISLVRRGLKGVVFVVMSTFWKECASFSLHIYYILIANHHKDEKKDLKK